MHSNALFLLILIFNNAYCRIVYPSTFVEKVEDILSRTYGEREVLLFKEMINDLHHGNTNWSERDEKDLINNIAKFFGSNSVELYKNILNHLNTPQTFNSYDDQIVISSINLFKQEFVKLNNLIDKHVIPQYHRFLQLKQHAAIVNNKTDITRHSDTVCWSPASCGAVESILNICTSIRGGADIVYDKFSVAVHVLGSVMAVLCGCIFVGPVHHCVLKNFPYTCKLPFPVFNSLLMANSMIWEVTKLTSVICRVYGDPGISSTLVRYNR
ncbi:conserved Plasmodium protein, unknown function [Babesia microti strain RI]|uniref:Uncharacterized protein n=1 Tax=Babesia microti (strain RI) TaxID=1133968 RepID=A0A1R4AA64_BABMR|nr:conserved Plasmodium protein, unknown function [Babesia microti strain RI]SJK85898.1 conserved Plasmodium protein, unknown function [Babesia microti strain RI]|eukprot:XP_021338108.1 conserved Plasmodium protein, unknown function [Babesia microti strain RI]